MIAETQMSYRTIGNSLAVVAAFAAVGCPAMGAAASSTAGTVTAVHDGHSFTLDGDRRIRVFGIDAPDLRQQCRADAIYSPGPSPCVPCGEHARQALAGLVLGKSVTCKDRGRAGGAADGVVVAECTVGSIQIGPWMLTQGQAVSDGKVLTRGDRRVYLGAETSAKRAAAGLWSETFVPPAEWRNTTRRLACER
jgi:endonuclease YncB( thermonuclease family)